MLEDPRDEAPVALVTRVLLARLGDRGQPRVHAGDVAVDQRRLLVERDRGDRPGRVATDPGDRAQGVGRARQLAAELLVDVPGPTMQEPRAPVIAESAPLLEHRVLAGRGQAREVGEPGQELRPISLHGLDPGLLEHDLGDPDRVGIASPPPGEVPSLDLEPPDQRTRHCADAAVVELGHRDAATSAVYELQGPSPN